MVKSILPFLGLYILQCFRCKYRPQQNFVINNASNVLDNKFKRCRYHTSFKNGKDANPYLYYALLGLFSVQITVKEGGLFSKIYYLCFFGNSGKILARQ